MPASQRDKPVEIEPLPEMQHNCAACGSGFVSDLRTEKSAREVAIEATCADCETKTTYVARRRYRFRTRGVTL